MRRSPVLLLIFSLGGAVLGFAISRALLPAYYRCLSATNATTCPIPVWREPLFWSAVGLVVGAAVGAVVWIGRWFKARGTDRPHLCDSAPSDGMLSRSPSQTQ